MVFFFPGERRLTDVVPTSKAGNLVSWDVCIKHRGHNLQRIRGYIGLLIQFTCTVLKSYFIGLLSLHGCINMMPIESMFSRIYQCGTSKWPWSQAKRAFTTLQTAALLVGGMLSSHLFGSPAVPRAFGEGEGQCYMGSPCCTQNEPSPKQKATLFLSYWKQKMTLLSQLNQDQNLVGFNLHSCKLKTRFGSDVNVRMLIIYATIKSGRG